MQILKFLCAGTVGTILYYIALYTLTEVIEVWYLISSIFASILNYSSNFIFQKFWTFENHDTQALQRQVQCYVAMTAVLFATNTILLYVLVEYAHFWYITAQIIVTAITTAISFLISRRIFARSSAA